MKSHVICSNKISVAQNRDTVQKLWGQSFFLNAFESFVLDLLLNFLH